MANTDIKHRMLFVLEEYERRHITATQVEEQIEGLMAALENITSRHLKTSRSLSARLVGADLTDDTLAEAFGIETPQPVVCKLREFITGLPD